MKSSILEIFTLLLIANLVSLIAWIEGLPINTGAIYWLLALFIYCFVALKFQIFKGKHFYIKIPSLSFKNLLIAVIAAILMATPSILFFSHPVIVGNINYSPIKNMLLSQLIFRLLIEIPFLTAIPEELLFRKFFFSIHFFNNKVERLLMNALIFTAWHLVVNLRTVLDAQVAINLPLLIISYIGSLISVFVGGVIFYLVRQKTGSVTYSIITHALADATLTLSAWLY